MSRPLEEYMQLPYRVMLTHDRDEDGNEGWVAEVAELPGCLSQGATPEEAAAKIRDAMRGWISVGIEDGTPIPEPGDDGYSGKFVVRLPSSLHRDVARAAGEEGISLNQFAVGVLASAVSWRLPPGMPAHVKLHEAIDQVLRGRSRGLTSRELADEINAQQLYIRPSDGQPVEAKQVAARVRRRTYRDRYRIDDDGRILLA